MSIRETETSTPRYVVAVVGAATAGSEIARILAERGAYVIVIEQNPRPYGKIEDGLPRWHVKQRKDEYEEINKRLDRPNIEYLPLTRMGREVSFSELRESWGLSAVVLAHGAWKDRPFPVDGADEFVDRGLVYQNPLIYWFNHYQEKSYEGPRYQLQPGTIVVGGGLASIDVVKVLQIESALRALAARGIDEEMLKLEREGIEPVLKAHNLAWSDLGVTPCKLFYRRRVLDMPLSDIPPDAPPKRADALRMARAKILEKAQRKFLFDFQELSVPTGLVVEDNRLVGIQMSRTELADGRVRTVAGSASPVRSNMTISSIGSIPESIPGIPQRGEVYEYVDAKVGLLMEGATEIFAAGNVLTGKGNIKDSLESGTEVGTYLAERYIGVADDGSRAMLAEGARREAHLEGEKIAEGVLRRPPLKAEKVAEIMKRVRECQREIGYDGDFRGWLARMTPPDLQ